MAALTSQLINQVGLNPSYASASAGGDTCNPKPRGFLHVKNGGVGSVTVTIPARVTKYNASGFGDITIDDISVAIPAGEDRMITIPPESHGAGGVASIAYSGVSSVTVAYLENEAV